MSAERRARRHRRPLRPNASATPRTGAATAAPRTAARPWTASGAHTGIGFPEAATTLGDHPIAAPRTAPRPDPARPFGDGPPSPRGTAAPIRAGFEAR